MTRGPFPHALTPLRPPQVGLVVLQSDETVEIDLRRLLAPDVELLVTRVPSGAEVTPETLAAMEHHLGAAAALFPHGVKLACAAYACTSGSAQIGVARIGEILSGAVSTASVTNPVAALVAACRSLGLRRLGLLSPYTRDVSDRLREVLAAEGIETPVFGSFEVAEEARVARIDGASIAAGAEALAAQGGIDGLFLSCTNLRTLDVIDGLESRLDLPVLSSNTVLAWHISTLVGQRAAASAPGRLFG